MNKLIAVVTIGIALAVSAFAQTPGTPDPPASLTLVSNSSTGVTSIDNVFQPRILASWTAPPDALTQFIQIQHQLAGATDWIDDGTVVLPGVLASYQPLTFSLILTGFIQSFIGSDSIGLGSSLLGFLVGFALPLALFVLGAVGGGDVKLLAMIAAFLGFWPAVLALFVGVMSASVWGVFLLVRGRANRMSRLAFGSFLSFGGLIAALFGERVISSYAALLR